VKDMADFDDDETEIEELEPDEVEVGGEEETPELEADEGEGDEVTVSIGDAPPADQEHRPAPFWVKEMRKRNKELSRRNVELEREHGAKVAAAVIRDAGPKPTLAATNYDQAKYEADMLAWSGRKIAADQTVAREAEVQKQQGEQWQGRLDSYASAKASLKVSDYDDAEDVVRGILSATEQGIILHAAEHPALLVYALGKNPAKARELAAINDPVRFAAAIGRIEKELKVTPMAKKPNPEKPVTGTGKATGLSDKRLDQLHDTAKATGDYTSYLAAKRKAQK